MVPSDARQVHMGPHLGPSLPPHANMLPGRAFPGAGECGWSSPAELASKHIFYTFLSPLSTNSLAVLSASQLATASFPLSPWKRLLGDRNSFTSKTLPGRVSRCFTCMVQSEQYKSCSSNCKTLCWTSCDLHIQNTVTYY